MELKADSHRGANRKPMGAWREVRVWRERVQREECMKLRAGGSQRELAAADGPSCCIMGAWRARLLCCALSLEASGGAGEGFQRGA